MSIEIWGWLFCSFVLGLFVKSFFPTYFRKKGENLATKEDISEITDKIESVKNDYANQLESAKTELSAKLNTNSFRYENEYNILCELTGYLVDLRDASISLRPGLDTKDANKSETEIKNERLKYFYAARKALYICSEKKRKRPAHSSSP